MNDLVNALWVLYLLAFLGTTTYLERHVDLTGLNRAARFGLTCMVILGGAFFPLTWVLIGIRRVRQVWR